MTPTRYIDDQGREVWVRARVVYDIVTHSKSGMVLPAWLTGFPVGIADERKAHEWLRNRAAELGWKAVAP
jgi:hypothetical protein